MLTDPYPLREGGTPYEVAVDLVGEAGAWQVEYPDLPFVDGLGIYKAYFTKVGPKTLYLRYNGIEEDAKYPTSTFSNFVQLVLARVDREGVTRLVIDLRFNLGGNLSDIAPLIEALKMRPMLAGPEHLFVLIGGGTYSAAVSDAATLKQVLGATLVGEPTGGELTVDSNTKWLTLPNSKLRVGYCTRRITSRFGEAGPLLPDRPVRSATIAQFSAGYDPVYRSVINEGTPAQ